MFILKTIIFRMRSRSVILLMLVFALTVWGVFFVHPQYLGQSRPWRFGLDLVGGTSLIYEVDVKDVLESDRDAILSGLRDVIENRINAFGVAEPRVVTAKKDDSYRIVVELAGVKDIGQAILQIGETPFLYFAELPSGESIDGEIGQGDFVPTELTGRYIRGSGKGAQISFNPVSGSPEISLIFDEEGAKLFEDITQRNVGRPLAVFVDDNLLTAPIVQGIITGGRAQITGNFTPEEAKNLVQRFNAGALSAPIRLLSQQTIGASLGADSLNKTIWAGALGTIFIIFFMLAYYGKLGVFASIALIIYSVLLLLVFKLFGITLTLSGIAGIILSVGMAIDANILIFERTKEENKKGLSRLEAIREGFSRAWPSIRDSNITTIISSLILYNFTSSFIRGFALALLLGVLVSMFTAITVTKNLLFVFVKNNPKSS